MSDIGNWPAVLTRDQRDLIIQSCPNQIFNFDFPKDKNNRKFSTIHYHRRAPNGELYKRDWLYYSIKNDAVYCFCCRLNLFDANSTRGFIAQKGFNDWQHLTRALQRHDASPQHQLQYEQWKELEVRFHCGTTIDATTQQQIANEAQRLRAVFIRIVAAIKYLAGQSLALRGSADKVNEDNNGNFMKYLESLTAFDPIMAEHLREGSRTHYLSKQSQEEFIQLIGNCIRTKILEMIKSSKYYSIIVDCTPDVSNQEQMTIIIRFVYYNTDTNTYDIQERFVNFLSVTNKTVIIKTIENTIVDKKSFFFGRQNFLVERRQQKILRQAPKGPAPALFGCLFFAYVSDV